MENFEDNIEKEYHERFQDFEEMPDDAVWNKIQARITPEPERRPIVFWWNNYRSVGIAASVLLGLLVGGYLLTTFDDTTNAQSTKITKSTSVGEEKQATQSTQLLSKRSEQLPSATQEKPIERVKESTEIFTEKTNRLASIKKEKPQDNTEKLATIKETTNQQVTSSEIEKNIVGVSEALVKKENTEPISDSRIGTQSQIKVSEASLASSNNLPSNVELMQESSNKTTEQSKIFTTELAFLMPKGTDIQFIRKDLAILEVSFNEPVYTFEEPRRERLVFIPPTEVYANVSPMLSYYVFSPNRADNFVVKDFNGSSNRLSFAAQMGVVYPLSKKIDIRTGLSFMAGKSSFSYGLINNSQKVVTMIDERTIQVQPSSTINIEQQNWQYLELQSDLLYAIKQLQAVSLGFRAGVQTSALNKPLLNGRIGYRISKPVNNRVALWLEPSVVVSLLSQESVNNHFMYHTTGFSLNMGVSLLRRD